MTEVLICNREIVSTFKQPNVMPVPEDDNNCTLVEKSLTIHVDESKIKEIQE